MYSTKWRYEFNHSRNGFVTYGETKPIHFKETKEREWILGDDTVDKLYKNVGVLKNYIGSFSSNVEDDINKTQRKAGMIFSSNFGRHKVNPFIPFMYITFWSQGYLPSLLYGSELFTLTPSFRVFPIGEIPSSQLCLPPSKPCPSIKISRNK